jgi:ferritin-like metal-binding protein YciE
MEMSDLQDLYLDELRDALHAENQLIKALPKMAKKASSPELQQAFMTHLEETRGHVERLNQIFENMGQKPKTKKCAGMEGILEEGKEFMEEAESEELMDAGLIASAQRAEHYEMAAYGTLRTYAKLLGDDKAARLLQQTLDEEGKTDKLLTKLAESGINVEAAEAQSDA